MPDALPDPAWFWAGAALMVFATLWLCSRRRDLPVWIFAVLVVVLALPRLDHALMFQQLPPEGLQPIYSEDGTPLAVPLPPGLGLPPAAWLLLYALGLVAGVLLVGHFPRRQWWLPKAPYDWGLAALLFVAVVAVWSLEIERLTYVRNIIGNLVYPLVGSFFLAQAMRSDEPQKRPLLLLAFAFFFLTVPPAAIQAYLGSLYLRGVRGIDPWTERFAADLVGGLLVAGVGVLCAGWAFVAARQRRSGASQFVWFAAGLVVLLVPGVVVWSLGVDPYPAEYLLEVVFGIAGPVAFAWIGGGALIWARPRGEDLEGLGEEKEPVEGVGGDSGGLPDQANGQDDEDHMP